MSRTVSDLQLFGVTLKHSPDDLAREIVSALYSMSWHERLV